MKTYATWADLVAALPSLPAHHHVFKRPQGDYLVLSYLPPRRKALEVYLGRVDQLLAHVVRLRQSA